MIWNRTLQPTLDTQLGVAHVSYSLRTGGMERLLVEYAKNADRDRYRLNFFCLTERGTPADDIEACGWPVYQLHKRAGFRWSAVTRLAKAFREQNIQIVHTHNSGAMIYGALAGRLAGLPVVIHSRHGQRFGSSRRQTWVFSRIARLVDRIVGVSQDVSDQSLAEGISARRIRTVLNGIDLQRFEYSGGSRTGPAILVARLVPEKDLKTLLEAAALVTRQVPSFQLQIVGDGPCRDEVVGHIERLQLGRHVQLLGERRDIPNLLRDASMFVMSSRTEGISLTLLEAMACGLPVVATEVGGNREVVRPRETGWLVPAGDAAGLADAMQRFWQDHALAAQFGLAGRKRVEQHFDVLQMVRQYETMYQEVLTARFAKHLPQPEAMSC